MVKSTRRRNRRPRGYIPGSQCFSGDQSQPSTSSRSVEDQTAMSYQPPEQTISRTSTPSNASSYETARSQLTTSFHTASDGIVSDDDADENTSNHTPTSRRVTTFQSLTHIGENPSSSNETPLPLVASKDEQGPMSPESTTTPKSTAIPQVANNSVINAFPSRTVTPAAISQLAREISKGAPSATRSHPTNPTHYAPSMQDTPSRNSGNVPRLPRRRITNNNMEKPDTTLAPSNAVSYNSSTEDGASSNPRNRFYTMPSRSPHNIEEQDITPKPMAKDPNSLLYSKSPANPRIDSIKKTFNADSPSFTPAMLPAPKAAGGTISSQAVNAAPFTPRSMAASGTSTPNAQLDPEPAAFNPAQIKEFTPQQNYDLSQTMAANGSNSESQVGFDPFQMSNLNQAMPSAPYNPYLEDNANMASNGAAYYQPQPNFTAPQQPLQYHQYAPVGPHREDLLPYQRLAHNLFIPNNLREELQKKSEATLQVMPNSVLPNLDPYHTLVALDTSQSKRAMVFGYSSWVYKATSSKNGYTYCLRRLELFRLTNEAAIKSVKKWQNVDNGGVVSVIDAFTTRAFGESSLIFVLNYHPLSKTLIEHHFPTSPHPHPHRHNNRVVATIPLHVMWNYIVQLASAIKAVHAANLAVRCMDPSKVIITSENRIRLSGCAVLDVVHFDLQRSIEELQQEDFIHFGKLLLAIGTNNLLPNFPVQTALEQLGRTYSSELRNIVTWLLTSAEPGSPKKIDDFVSGISGHVISALDSTFHQTDNLTSEMIRELENGRLVRLMAKLGMINERPEYENDPLWAETGPRYMLKLFRDYVFHQVDANGKPVTDLTHVIRCMNKLDAGIEELITLMSRDEDTIMIVAYKELKKEVNAAFTDLQKQPARGRY